MSEGPVWRILAVDDDQEICQQIKEAFQDEPVSSGQGQLSVETHGSFVGALDLLESRRFDVLILDVRQEANWTAGIPEDDTAGAHVLEEVQRRVFVPVIFYTGVPHRVEDLSRPSLIYVVEKTEGIERLQVIINEIVRSGLPAVNKALIGHVEKIQRDYMWGFVANHWDEFSGTADSMDLAYLLAHRLALSLTSTGIGHLATTIDGTERDVAVPADKVHPMRFYIMPALDGEPLAGTLYHGPVGKDDRYWILLTPSCDLATHRQPSKPDKPPKADHVILASCFLLTEQEEYRTWKGMTTPSKAVEGALTSLLTNNRKDKQSDRFFFLPSAMAIPDLLVDYQRIVSIPLADLSNLERLASLDSPFSESLLARFAQYFGRLGTPDLDTDTVMNRLRPQA